MVYDGRTQYRSDENRLEFNKEQISTPIVIGEEISHYLHLQLNPIHKTALQDIFDATRLVTTMETVGRYGALVYINQKGIEIAPFSKQKGFSPDMSRYLTDDFSHNYGYKMAYKLMELHGDSMLPIVSRMSINDFIKALSRIAPSSWWAKNVTPKIDRITGYKPDLSLAE